MERDLYRRWSSHPLRAMLRESASRTIRDDELDDLRLPDRVRRATRQAIRRIRDSGERPDRAAIYADHLSAELVEALDPDHETRHQYEDRRAEAGDPQALAAVNARREANDALVDRILDRGF